MSLDFQKSCIRPTHTIRDASACIEASRAKIALVTDERGHLLDTITDGDIRRAILSGIDLATPVVHLREKKLNSPYRQPTTAPLGTDAATLLRILRTHNIQQLPLLDAEQRVAGLVTLAELVEIGALPLHAVIMAGGFGVRLRPLTDDLPKPMLPVGDRPLLELIIERLRHAGIRRISVLTHYKSEAITDYFGDGGAFGVDIDYVLEEKPLGTAGALTLLKAGRDPLLVLNGDILTRIDFAALLDFHREHRADITVGVREYDFRVPYGVVETEGARVVAISEKPVVKYFVNAGIYLLQPEAREVIPRDTNYDMPTLINTAATSGRTVVSFPVHEYWLDIGQMDDYRKADADVRSGAVDTHHSQLP